MTWQDDDTAAGEPHGSPEPAASQVPPVPHVPHPPPAQSAPTPGHPRRRGGVMLAALVVLAAVIGAVVAAGSYALFDRDDSASSGIARTSQVAPVTAGAGTIPAAAASISPKVVTINVAGAQSAGTGSGVVVRADGYVLTNNHVVSLDSGSAAGNRITVTLDDGTEKPATLTGADPTDDLAVVRIQNAPTLSAATFADSNAVQVGQGVVAVGAPLGLSNTVTSGIVSALDRPVQAGSSGTAIFAAIQTDAAINPGNSGGPLVDLLGNVVGINSAIATAGSGSNQSGSSGNIGIGFAIPSNEATRIANELIATGKATHAILGVSVDSAPASQGGGPTSAAGATVQAVAPGGPAARAGIRPRDVITRVGEQRIDSSTGLIAAVRSNAPGDTVQVSFDRNGTSRTVAITLAGASD